MKNSLIVANWKSNKTIPESLDWLSQFVSGFAKTEGKEVILCTSFPLLYPLREQIAQNDLDIKLGTQDVSQFPEGPYTGEVNAGQIKNLATYVLVGHSERRRSLGETEDVIGKKIEQVLEAGLNPVLCVQDENAQIPGRCDIVAYEPPDAISTSGPNSEASDPERIERIASFFKSQRPGLIFLYGGSVDDNNVRRFTEKDSIDGVLVGAKSLSAEEFLRICQNA